MAKDTPQLPLRAKSDRLQSGDPVASSGAARANRGLVVDEFAVTDGDDLLPAGRKPLDTAALQRIVRRKVAVAPAG
jgi:hypothetical protein